MQTWKITEPFEPAALREAALLLQSGGLVAFPTETVYGLGANAFDNRAVEKIFAAKGRPSDNPLIVHIADLADLNRVVSDPAALTPLVRRAAECFWPGPLTLILPAHAAIAPAVRPGMAHIGVRLPAHPVARELIRQAKCPIAAPSANQSGRPSPTNAADVLEDMRDRIDGLVDGGSCRVGVESTVVAIGEDSAVIYRPGGISQQQLSDALGIPVSLDAHLVSQDAAPKAPGMKYRHYAPNASVHVYCGRRDHVEMAFAAFAACHKDTRLAVIAPWDTARAIYGPLVASWSPDEGESYDAALARELYRLLRDFDRAGAEHILVCGPPSEGIGAAVMNRLGKASEGRVHLL